MSDDWGGSDFQMEDSGNVDIPSVDYGGGDSDFQFEFDEAGWGPEFDEFFDDIDGTQNDAIIFNGGDDGMSPEDLDFGGSGNMMQGEDGNFYDDSGYLNQGRYDTFAPGDADFDPGGYKGGNPKWSADNKYSWDSTTGKWMLGGERELRASDDPEEEEKTNASNTESLWAKLLKNEGLLKGLGGMGLAGLKWLGSKEDADQKMDLLKQKQAHELLMLQEKDRLYRGRPSGGGGGAASGSSSLTGFTGAGGSKIGTFEKS